jgi:peptide/nickel transport system permease protein
MIRYLIRRVLWAIVLFLSVTVVTFVIFFVTPKDTARQMCGKGCGPADITRVEKHFHLKDPIYQQYYRFLKGAVTRFDFGNSFINRQPVRDLVLTAAPATAALVFGGAILWMLVALPIGILSALRPRSLLDRAAMIFVLIGISAHPVWIGLILSWAVGYKLGWTPITGYCDFFNPDTQCGGPVPWFSHMILPWITFALLFSALYVRMIRANVLETLNEDYVRTARAKGAPNWLVMRSHVLRNAMLPVVTMLGMDIGLALGGAIFTEGIYSIPGLGNTAFHALTNYDSPTLMGVVVFSTTCIIVFNLAVDLVYAAIDPRIRLS